MAGYISKYSKTLFTTTFESLGTRKQQKSSGMIPEPLLVVFLRRSMVVICRCSYQVFFQAYPAVVLIRTKHVEIPDELPEHSNKAKLKALTENCNFTVINNGYSYMIATCFL